MFPVSEIWDETCKIIGNSNEPFLFRRITDAVELLANKGEWDPLVGALDICTSGRVVTLPREVETILALNMIGQPAIARDMLFQFHLNGPGQGRCGSAIHWSWMDLGDQCVFRELKCPSKLIGFCTEAADENCEFWVKGYDQNQNRVRTLVGTEWRDGWKVPIFRASQALPADAPIFSRIAYDGISKSVTAGPIRLSTLDGDDQTGVLLGIYQADETTPAYRRIQLSQRVPWVRIAFRRRTFELHSRYDLIPLHNRQAVIMALRALKAYDEPGRFAEAEAFEATAVRWLQEEQYTRTPPVVHPIQVEDGAPLMDAGDYID